MLIEKNQMLDELLQRIDNGGDTGQITRSTVIELKNQIRAHASEEDEWHKFRAHFEQVHPGFSSDLKRCTLLSLNMNYAFAHTYAPECMANKLP